MLLKVENVSKVFKQGEIQVKALKSVNVEVDVSEFTTLVGPSGSGKTTLLNLVGAIDSVTEGKIIMNSKPYSEEKASALTQFRLENLGFIFQSYNLIPVFTAIENVEYVLELQQVDKKERRERARQVLADLDLSELESRFPREMSGGQQQRVAVARALVTKPPLVLADEPTANLDSENAERLLGLMQKMNEKYKTTFLFSTHDDRVKERASRVISLRDGEVINDLRA
jgi:putative ABC transport system ATP-binding protein